ncbi:MAG: LPS-assembly protein LptD [Geminicoccaceae bacterium]
MVGLRSTGAIVLLMTLLIASAPGRALDLGEGPVLLTADEVTFDAEENVVTASGNVQVTRGERRLLADTLRYDQDTDQMEAEGNVALLEPSGDTLFADRVTLSGDLREGAAEQLRARLVDDSLIAAEGGRRTSGNRTELDRAVFSPCPLCPDSAAPPLWQISARRVIHDQAAQNIYYHHAFFELAGVPVFYMPYFLHPDPTVKRRSGFLAPGFGSDSALGLSVEIPYYFALAPNYDVTLAPIFFTQENPVLTAEYRHLLPSGGFEFAVSGTDGSKPIEREGEPQPSGTTFRGAIEGEGRFRLNRGWRWGFDLAAATDDTYLERYNFSNEDVLNNRLFAQRYWERDFVTLDAYGFQGLRENDDQGLIPIALPQAQVHLTSDPMVWSSRFTFDADVLALTRFDGLDTRRVSSTGAWILPWQSPIGDRYELRLDVRGDLYQTNGDPETFEDNGSNTTARVIPRATLHWGWPWIGEAFGASHVIEPVAMATAATSGNNGAQIPNEDSQDFEFDDASLLEPNRFPGLDRVEGGSSIAYGIRFGTYTDRPVLSGLFGQAYAFEKDPEFDPSTGLDEKLSDFVGRVNLTPAPWLNLRYRFRLDKNDLTFVRNELGVVTGPPRVRFDVSYLMLEDDPALQSLRGREEIRAGVSLRPLDSLSLRALTRYNLAEDRIVSHQLGLIYTHPCLQLAAGVERRNTTNRDAEDSTTFSVRLTFRHLGEIGVDSLSVGGGES